MRLGLGGVLLLVLVLAVGCASGAPGGSPSPAPAGELTVRVDDGHGTVTTWRLTCDPTGGDHPDPEAACRALTERGAQALPPVAKDRQCTQVYGGPATAQITGTWRGAAVDSRLSLVNGCEISRWRALTGLLPPAEG